MRHAIVILLVFLLPSWVVANSATTPRATSSSEWTSAPDEIDDVARFRSSVLAAPDTQWIADWSFDGGNPCDPMGWTAVDLRAPTPQPVYWSLGNGYHGVGGVAGNAAILAHHDLCWVIPDGYGNDWYQAIAIRYGGQTLLSASYLLDSEAGFDFFQVEVDSACASAQTAGERPILFSDSGFEDMGSLDALLLPDFDAPQDTHCVYLAFFSDGGLSQQDGLLPTQLAAGLVVDHVVLADAGNPGSPALIPFVEDFEGMLNPHVSFTTLAAPWSTPGLWARLETLTSSCRFQRSCGWVFSDPDLVCLDAAGFGCVPEGIDNVIVSPWVSLASTPGSQATFLSFREQQPMTTGSRTVRGWSVRSRVRVDDTDTPAPGDSIDCPTPWGHAFSWNSLGTIDWRTETEDLTSWIDPAATAIQLRIRVSDWNWIAGGSSTDPMGPGPWIDRVRIGRTLLTGPVFSEGIDSRSQAQDGFPTEVDPTFPGSTGERYRPSTDRFATCAFSPGGDIGIGTSSRLVLGDSIWIEVTDARGAGGVTSVQFYGAIVAGPHEGKSPPPWTVESNGFFCVEPDTGRASSGQAVAGFWFVDLDDDYFRGGDELVYFWLATDAQGGIASDPVGLDHVPASILDAQQATDGLLEVSFLPTINWDPAYVFRVRSDPYGKLEPTAQEIANSSQANCIFYTQSVNPRRRAGDLHRTSLMYLLDRIGYLLHYDVYDVQGYGNTNNQMAGRATIEQAESYNLLIAEAGNLARGAPVLPDGSDLDAQKLDQAGWYRDWLAQASGAEAQFATLWLLGSNFAEEKSTNPLLANDMGVVFSGASQSMGVSPEIEGQASFTFDQGIGSSLVNFSGDLFSLAGGCLSLPREVLRIRNYDALEAAGTAVVTHRYRSETSLGEGAIVMNRNNAEAWNTILASFPWLDIRDPAGTPASAPPEAILLSKIIGGALPVGCLSSPQPTDVSGEETLAAPRYTVLRRNAPNPFNPVTTIEFDLAATENVQLRLYDVAGRLVRTLVDEVRSPARHRVVWDGQDDRGRPVPTGVYFARLHVGAYQGSCKLVVLR